MKNILPEQVSLGEHETGSNEKLQAWKDLENLLKRFDTKISIVNSASYQFAGKVLKKLQANRIDGSTRLQKRRRIKNQKWFVLKYGNYK